VVTEEALPAGCLLGVYAGDYLSNAEAQRRLKQYDAAGRGHALLVLRELLPSRTAALRLNIDATRRGNITSFLNHACNGGNLQLLLGRSVAACKLLPLWLCSQLALFQNGPSAHDRRRTGCLLPRVVFATSRAVEAGEELTWAYGPPNPVPGSQPCYCNTPACLGYMPREDT
jgi:histone-lysine N-methyltransferase SETMAR